MTARIEAELDEDGKLTHFLMEGSVFGLQALARFIAREADDDIITCILPDDEDESSNFNPGFTQ